MQELRVQQVMGSARVFMDVDSVTTQDRFWRSRKMGHYIGNRLKRFNRQI